MDKLDKNSQTHDEVLLLRKNQWLEKNFSFSKNLESLQTNPQAPLILTSPSDLGVVRNGGRSGAQYSPQAILAVLKKMIRSPHTPDLLQFFQVFEQNIFMQNKDDHFQELQNLSSNQIHLALKKANPSTLIHLGGGHDHVFCLLKGLDKLGLKKITVINIDAHCDTRGDVPSHSGNPFRQFASQTQGQFTLYQIGVHLYANDRETLAPLPLPQNQMILFPFAQIMKETHYFRRSLSEFLKKNIPWESDRVYLLSLDCDALESPLMEGVSAVNHQGFSLNHMVEILHWYLNLPEGKIQSDRGIQEYVPHKIFGIYEYNPLYDNLSQKGARALGSMIYQVIHPHSQP